MSDVFEGTGVKRYALRCRADYFEPWQYPTALEYDTGEAAEAARKGMDAPGKYQVVERYPCIRYKPAGAEEAARSKLLDNVLAAAGRKPFMLQWSNGRGWRDCEDRQYDTLEEAQEKAYSGPEGTHRVLAAELEIRYEPVGEV